MFHLVTTERNKANGIVGYLWQTAPQGYSYQVEILNIQGDLLHKADLSVNVEEALEVLRQDMLIVSKSEASEYSLDLEDFS